MASIDLKQRLQGKDPLVVPGCYDALSAALAEAAGFEAVLVSGYAVAASWLGRPDVDLYSQAEMATACRNVCRRVSIPVMADADNGYGNALNVMRTVVDFESAGVAALTLEDQLSPKRCPLLGRAAALADLDEAVGKLRAAVAARRDPRMLIVARTDATDPDEVMARARAYAQAGVDAVKLISPALRGLEDLRRVRQACGVPLMIASLGWAATIEPIYFQGLVGAITHPIMPLATAAAAMQANLLALRQQPHGVPLPVPPLSQPGMEKVLGMARIHELEQAYLPAR